MSTTEEVSEAKRQSAVKEWQATVKKRAALVSQSLAFSSSSNQRIKFDDSSDEEEEKESSDEEDEKQSTDEEDDEEPKAKKPTKARERTTMARLFDSDDNSSSDDGHEAEEIEKLMIKSQFFGKSGEKLHKLQAKIGSDARFQMDARFAEKSKGDVDNEIPAQPSTEQSQAYNVLESVLGKAVQRKSPKTASKSSVQSSLVRFDPTNPAHHVFDKSSKSAVDVEGEEGEKEVTRPKKKGPVVQDVVDSSSEDSSDEQSEGDERLASNVPAVSVVHLDTAFADELRAKMATETKPVTEPATSLLSMLGKADLIDSSPTVVVPRKRKADRDLAPDAEPPMAPMKDWQRELLEGGARKKPRNKTKAGDSDTDSSSDDTDEPMVEVEKESPIAVKGGQSSSFFPSPTDVAVLHAMNSFRRTVDDKTMEKQWRAMRDKVVTSFKRTRKRALVKKRVQLRQSIRTADNLRRQ